MWLAFELFRWSFGSCCVVRVAIGAMRFGWEVPRFVRRGNCAVQPLKCSSREVYASFYNFVHTSFYKALLNYWEDHVCGSTFVSFLNLERRRARCCTLFFEFFCGDFVHIAELHLSTVVTTGFLSRIP